MIPYSTRVAGFVNSAREDFSVLAKSLTSVTSIPFA